jgi:formylglycine-generating enzyme required for sulfatase activity
LGSLPNDPFCAKIPGRVWEELLGQSMVWVPPGPFRMGSDREKDRSADGDELPQHSLALPGYWIGRTPVTVAQFRAFVEGSGHRPRDEGSLRKQDDHPVVNVSWHDALAHCRWLEERTGLPVSLPSEAEWEKAARGVDGRTYPWGEVPPDETRCNFANREGGTTAVGRYSPRGDSPYGCADMAGNVWEWTRSLYKGYPYDPEDGREDLDASGNRAWRGGCWLNVRRNVRCAVRIIGRPGSFLDRVGFRVVLPASSTS